MFSIWFFRWLCSTFDYKPDSVSLSLLFGSLLDARAAKGFLDSTGFNPEVTLLERYVKCLCKDGLVDEGIKVSEAYELLKKSLKQGLDPGHAVLLGVKPSDRTYAALRKMRNLKMSDSVAASLNEILESA
ncbi:unnamed protein product [Brassica napus]|uniref:(rape) hypothetical protein n=1 Tax=Brassica napus TaxID=3708 RepID=A0A816I3M4_BRANA|nr:unnamed protein product [Brassica napus]